MKLSMLSTLAASAVVLVSAVPTEYPVANGLRTVHQFPNRTWIENMAIRKNGQILGTDISNSRIYLVDPKKAQADPPVVAQFPSGTCLTGIVEMEEDVFYTQSVQGDVYRFTFQPNTSAIWRVDMRKYSRTGQATVTQAASIPSVRLPNGMSVLSRSSSTILLSDSLGGQIWRVDLRTGQYEPVISGPNLDPIPTARPPFGVNGIQVVGKQLYFVNTNRGLAVKVPINTASGRTTGPQTVITSQVPTADDFALDSRGNMYLAQNARNTLVRVAAADGEVQIIAGGANSTELFGPVAARFGRGKDDRNVLYISTDGLSGFTEQGVPRTTDGKIAAIRV